ncbi:hypothetical protein P775_03425 [Puniceibacterium antarcticum]|uniref:Aminoglycoside phosphotransferase domain-containing protein n=1 Tax=Puniceibacterium antarcticum TaxID=1206336 RepID=A0A2G8RJ70_9RHOB|nr:phosphotransferase [Puniceibacterium antarcticum]PIL21615.1 hypothetical protein P775_03425 [Puniceibacterium antarcticum]
MERPPIERWGIAAELVPLVGGHRNLVFKTAGLGFGRELVFKSTQRPEAAMRWLAGVQEIARATGFVVPEQMAGRNGHLVEDGWICENFVEGEPFSPEDVPSVLPLVLAFHGATAGVPQRPGFLSSRDLIQESYGGDVDLRAMPIDLVSSCREAWLTVSERMYAVIHGDLNSGNLIRCPDGRVSLIDWDECRRDLVLFDIEPLRGGDEEERRARLAWEVACSWLIEPVHARQIATRL